jgi:SAM-dependent methyltransferase
MREWYKYFIDPSQQGKVLLPLDQTFEDHAQAIGGYGSDPACLSKSDFFDEYFWGYHYGRLEYYDDFLRRYLSKNDQILSIASGRCANELYLLEDGYRIICSDLQLSEANKETQRLFGNYEFLEINILEDEIDRQFDAVICLSLIYLFNNNELDLFFRKVNNLLKPGGRLLLDSAGSPDNFLSYLILDILLKSEAEIKWAIKSLLSRKKLGFIIKHHGYRRTDAEIIASAAKSGFEMIGHGDYAFLNEFRRSSLLDRIIKSSSLAENIFEKLGKNIPYIRMFNFQKMELGENRSS